MLNEKLDATEALRIGLVTRVVSDSELLARALILAEQLAAKPPIALRHIKQNLTETTPDFLLANAEEARRNVLSGRTAERGRGCYGFPREACARVYWPLGNIAATGAKPELVGGLQHVSGATHRVDHRGATSIDLATKIGDVELDHGRFAVEVVTPHPVEDLRL